MLTAHPTEVQRKSILDAERAIAELLERRDAVRADFERQAIDALLRARVTQLWQTRMLRTTKLTVADEIENALSYYHATFLRQIPRMYQELEAALPGHAVGNFFRMGNWIGGDRDGNPFVTADTLRMALSRQSETALRFYLTEVHELGAELSISAMLAPVTPEMAKLAEASPDHNPHREDEPYRRALVGMYARLAATLQALTGTEALRHAVAPQRAYTDAQVLEEIGRVYRRHEYLLDPHSAIAWLALQDALKAQPDADGVFVATAHPGKFREVVEPAIGRSVPLPRPLQDALGRPRHSVTMDVNYDTLRDFLRS